MNAQNCYAEISGGHSRAAQKLNPLKTRTSRSSRSICWPRFEAGKRPCAAAAEKMGVTQKKLLRLRWTRSWQATARDRLRGREVRINIMLLLRHPHGGLKQRRRTWQSR